MTLLKRIFLQLRITICLCPMLFLPVQNAYCQIKNVILMIGDGMGPQQVALALLYQQVQSQRDSQIPMLALQRIMQQGEVGLMMTQPYQKLVVDSACSASQLATGQYSRSEMIALDKEGNPLPTILEKAKLQGKSVGLVSDTRITHATPASFATHVAHRHQENEIAEQLLEAQVDVLLSGGLRYFLPNTMNKTTTDKLRQLIPPRLSLKSKRKDNKNLILRAKQQNYDLVFNRNQLLETTYNPHKKLLGLFTSSAMPDAIKAVQNKRSIPSLSEMSQVAINRLAKNPQGFFLMIEAGQIDWAGHANDVGTLLHEMLRFNQALQAVMQWVDGRDDTLLVVTADHETGSFGFTYSSFEVPKATSLTGSQFRNRSFKANYNFASPNILFKIYRQKMSLHNLVRKFKKLPRNKQTASQLMHLVNANLAFKITRQQAVQLIQQDQQRVNQTTGLLISNVTQYFYPYSVNAFAAAIARAISPQQSVVWGTGTHTSTPVPVIAYGQPDKVIKQFDGMHHSTEIGRLMMELFLKKQ
jgi:alkaline phosphatase